MQIVFLPHYWQSTRLLMAKNIQCIFSSLSTTCIFPSLLAKYTDHVFTSLWQSTQTILYVINRKYVETVLYTPILWNTQFWYTLMQSTQTVLHRPYILQIFGKAHRPLLAKRTDHIFYCTTGKVLTEHAFWRNTWNLRQERQPQSRNLWLIAQNVS